MPTTDPKRRFRLTPGHCLLVLLALEFLLFLSQWFRWLPKGWPVLIAIATVVVVVLGMFVWFGVAVIFGRRFQFSIRSLLVLTVVVALPCSSLAVEMKDAREQRKAVEAIEHLGGGVWYDWLWDHTLRRHGSPTGPDWLRSLFGPDFFAEVSVVTFNTNDFKDFENTNASLPLLKGFTRLQWLDLGNSRVTDNGLESIRELTQLEDLRLNGSGVTDAGLNHLTSLSQLRVLYLSSTHITDESVAKLQKALPNCKITR